MISDLDQTLQRLLAGEAAAGSELATATILFAAPDKDWRAKASGLVLNIYLCRITENRDLRSGERRVTRGADAARPRRLPLPAHGVEHGRADARRGARAAGAPPPQPSARNSHFKTPIRETLAWP